MSNSTQISSITNQIIGTNNGFMSPGSATRTSDGHCVRCGGSRPVVHAIEATQTKKEGAVYAASKLSCSVIVHDTESFTGQAAAVSLGYMPSWSQCSGVVS